MRAVRGHRRAAGLTHGLRRTGDRPPHLCHRGRRPEQGKRPARSSSRHGCLFGTSAQQRVVGLSLRNQGMGPLRALQQRTSNGQIN
jgi:hypothetical protein